MHNGSALLRVDATVTSVRIKVSAGSFPFLSSFFFISHAKKTRSCPIARVFPPHNFESDHKSILAIPETIELKYTIEKEMNYYFRECKVEWYLINNIISSK